MAPNGFNLQFDESYVGTRHDSDAVNQSGLLDRMRALNEKLENLYKSTDNVC